MPKDNLSGVTSIRFAGANAGDDRRWLAGVAVASKCDHATAALVGVRGQGLDAVCDVVGVQTAPIPRSTVVLYESIANAAPGAVLSLATLRTQLSEVEAALVQELLDAQGISPSRVLAVGVDDPGLWEGCRGEVTGYLGLCDPARLAEATGLNVIDSFAARDVAAGGQGGPLTGLTDWVLLRDRLRNRVLLDLGRTVRLGYLPAARRPRAETGIVKFEVGPGMSLLDLLTQRLTGGQNRFDPGGRLAVQGKRIGELVDHWMANPYFDTPLPRWHAHGVRPERFLTDALQMAVASDWSVRDLLCSATHFLGEMIARTLQRLPNGEAVDEIIVTGGGQHNGMLLHEIGRLAERPLARLEDFNIPVDSLDAVGAALLAVLHLDQTPANPTSITRAATPRLLGRLTSGSPQNWRLLLETCAGGSQSLRPLRTAV